MTLDEAVRLVTEENQSQKTAMLTITTAIKRYRREQGLEPLTLAAITVEGLEVEALLALQTSLPIETTEQPVDNPV